jgi:ribosomal protein S7
LKKSEFIDPLLIFFVAITNITPEILLFPLKLGGVTSEVAMPISLKKQIIFSTK